MAFWGGWWGNPWGLEEVDLLATVPYLDKDQAQTLCFDERLGTDDWDNASDTDKTKALQMATVMINGLHFVGRKTGGESQENEFPRDVSDGLIPESVQRATCEIALALLQGLRLEKLAEDAGVLEKRVGDASTSYSERGRQQLLDENLGLPSPSAARLLREWLVNPRHIQVDRV